MKLRHIFSTGMCVLGGLYAQGALATCSVAPDSGQITLGGGPLANLVVDSDLPVGAIIRDISLNPDGGNGSSRISCNGAAQVGDVVSSLYRDNANIPDQVRELVMADGTPSGIGVRLEFEENGMGGYQALPATQTRTFPLGNYLWTVAIRGSLVKVGPTVYGAVRAGDRVARSQVLNTTPAFQFNRLRYVDTGAITIVRPACSIDTGSLNQEVRLGNYNVGEVAGGTVTPDWVPFNLTMGACADPASLLTDITFGEAADADGRNPDLFSMNTNGPGGLGIAIQTNGGTSVPMLPGQSREFATVATGQNYPFRARLERNGDAVTAGRVNRPVRVLVTFR